MSWKGKRGFKRSPYHYDDRTGLRERLENLQWERGILTTEVDTMLIGQREAMVANALTSSPEEAAPDEKLKTPDAIDDEIVMP